MFVSMKKLLCLLTVLLMCTVSYGANNVTAEKQKPKVLVIGHGSDFVMFAKALKNLGGYTVISVTTETEDLGREIGDFKFTAGNAYLEFDYVPIKPDNPKQFYKEAKNSISKKVISSKAKHYRKSRDAI